MARGKKQNDLTEKNVKASEDDGWPNKVNEKFSKVAAKTKIKSITREIDIIKVKFKNLTFSPGQEPQLAEWMDNEDELLVTLEQFQSRFTD